MKRTFTGVLLAGFVAVLLGAVWLTFASPFKLYVVYTGSMSPAIPPRSAIIIDTRLQTPEPGEVYTFMSPNGPVTHRLVSVTEGNIVTKGDANASADSTHLPVSNIIGKVIYAPREVGFWLEYFKNPINWFVIVLLIFGVPYLWSLDKKQSIT